MQWPSTRIAGRLWPPADGPQQDTGQLGKQRLRQARVFGTVQLRVIRKTIIRLAIVPLASGSRGASLERMTSRVGSLASIEGRHFRSIDKQSSPEMASSRSVTTALSLLLLSLASGTTATDLLTHDHNPNGPARSLKSAHRN